MPLHFSQAVDCIILSPFPFFVQMPLNYFVTALEHGKKITKIVLCFEHNYEKNVQVCSINIRSSYFLCGNYYVIRNNQARRLGWFGGVGRTPPLPEKVR